MSDKLDEIFRTVFELPNDADVRNIAQQSFPAWDSLAHVMLIGALESEFGFEVDVADSVDITSYQLANEYIETRTHP